jgi:hypothetical protein
VGKPFSTPSNAVEQAQQKAGERGQAILGVATAFANLINNLGTDIQQSAAKTAFYAKQVEIENMLDKNPGMGVMVELLFFRTEQDPDSLLKPADQFQELIAYLASSPRDIPAGIYPGQKNATLIIRRRWLQPRKPAPGAAAAQPDTEGRSSIFLQSAGMVESALNLIRSQKNLSAGRVFEAFAEKKADFVKAQVEVGGFLLEMSSGVYHELFPKLEQAAIDSFTRSINRVDAVLRELRTRYDKLRTEGAFTRWWRDRTFELPKDTLLDGAQGSVTLARDWLAKKDFKLARSNYETAKFGAEKVLKMLDDYENKQQARDSEDP